MTEQTGLRRNVRFNIDEAMNIAVGYGQGQETAEADRAALERATDRVIALVEADVRERLLSDEAKAAAGKSLYNNRVIELDQAGDDDWDILPWQDEWIEGAEDVLHAALSHIGLEVLHEGEDL